MAYYNQRQQNASTLELFSAAGQLNIKEEGRSETHSCCREVGEWAPEDVLNDKLCRSLLLGVAGNRRNSVGHVEDGNNSFQYVTYTWPFYVFGSACSVLGVAQLDSVIMASPPIEDGVNLSLEHLQPYWEELENLVQSKKIVAIGTSDLDKTQLEQLYQWAQVKPSGT